MNKLLISAVLAAASLQVQAFEAASLQGTWCFYEQEVDGNKATEQVTITLNKDGSYQWSDVAWQQSGTWSVSDNKLVLSDVGSHQLVKVSGAAVEMTRGSTMRLRKGACN